MNRRQTLKLLSVISGVSLLGGCKAPQPPLRVGSIVFPGYELIFLARDMDLLDERQVRLLELRSNTDTMRALSSGQLEAGNLTLDEMMLARADGVDLRAILILDVSAGADVVMARAGISLKNLAGKRIGYEDGAAGTVMMEGLLHAANLLPQQVRKVRMTLDQSEEKFRTGAVDVVVSAEPWASRIEKLGARRIYDSTVIPGRIVDVLAVRADAMQSHGTALRRLVEAHFAARQQFLQDPKTSSERMAARLQTPPEEVAAQFRGLSLPDARENLQMMLSGGQFDRTAQELQHVMLNSNILGKAMVVQSLATPEFLPL